MDSEVKLNGVPIQWIASWTKELSPGAQEVEQRMVAGEPLCEIETDLDYAENQTKQGTPTGPPRRRYKTAFHESGLLPPPYLPSTKHER